MTQSLIKLRSATESCESPGGNKRIHMHDNARPGGDCEYRADLSIPLDDDLFDRGGQPTRLDDNIGCRETRATFRG